MAKKKIPKKAALVAQMANLRDEIDRIEEFEFQEKYARLYRKTFKYRNCYSCPKGPEDYWWIYCRVLNVEGRWVKVIDFQCDRDGRLSLERKQDMAHRFDGGSGWIEIEEEEFLEAYRNFVKTVPASV